MAELTMISNKYTTTTSNNISSINRSIVSIYKIDQLLDYINNNIVLLTSLSDNNNKNKNNSNNYVSIIILIITQYFKIVNNNNNIISSSKETDYEALFISLTPLLIKLSKLSILSLSLSILDLIKFYNIDVIKIRSYFNILKIYIFGNIINGFKNGIYNNEIVEKSNDKPLDTIVLLLTELLDLSLNEAINYINMLLSLSDHIYNIFKLNIPIEYRFRSIYITILFGIYEIYINNINYETIFNYILIKIINKGYIDICAEVIICILNYLNEKNHFDRIIKNIILLPLNISQSLLWAILLRINHHNVELGEKSFKIINLFMTAIFNDTKLTSLQNYCLVTIWTKQIISPNLTYLLIRSFQKIDASLNNGIIKAILYEWSLLWRDPSFLRHSTNTQHRQIAFALLSALQILSSNKKEDIDWIHYNSSTAESGEKDALSALPDLMTIDPESEVQESTSTKTPEEEVKLTPIYNLLCESKALHNLLDGISLRLTASLPAHRQLAQHVAHMLSKAMSENNEVHFPLSYIQNTLYTMEFNLKPFEEDPLISCGKLIANIKLKIPFNESFNFLLQNSITESLEVPNETKLFTSSNFNLKPNFIPKDSKSFVRVEIEDLDDDLEPMHDVNLADMTLEESVSIIPKPIYLADLLIYLQSDPTKASNQKIETNPTSAGNIPLARLEMGLNSASSLIDSKPFNLRDLCLSICDVLLSMHSSYTIENYDQLKLGILVSLCCTCHDLIIPKLLERLKNDTLSIYERLMILDVMMNSSTRLATPIIPKDSNTDIAKEASNKITVKSDNSKNEMFWWDLKKVEENIAQESKNARWDIIDARLANKTKRFNSGKSSNNNVSKNSTQNMFSKISSASFFFPLLACFLNPKLTSVPIHHSSNTLIVTNQHSFNLPWWTKLEKDWASSSNLSNIMNDKISETSVLSRWMLSLVHIAACAGPFCLELPDMIKSLLPLFQLLSSHPQVGVRRCIVLSAWRLLTILPSEYLAELLSTEEITTLYEWISNFLSDNEVDEQIQSLAYAVLIILQELMELGMKAELIRTLESNNTPFSVKSNNNIMNSIDLNLQI